MFHLVVFALVFLFGPNSLIEKAVLMDPDAGGRQPFEQVWVITVYNDAGVEAIVQARIGSGEIIPLIATNRENLNAINVAASAIAREEHVKLRLVKFSQRSDVGEIVP